MSPRVVGLAVLVALVFAAFVPVLRLPLLLALAVGVALAARGSAASWASAAGLPAATILAWGYLAGDHFRADLVDCANLLAPVAWLRVAEAVVVIGLIVLLARRLGVGVRSFGLERPTQRELVLGILALAIIPVTSLYLGSVLAEPFFGPIRLHLAEPLAIVPALLLAIANGSMEELAYRGALMSWSGRVLGPGLGLVGQAVVFGAAHSGSDFVGPILPVLLVVAAGGLLAGLWVRRTGSLWLPIVVHICFDVPLYYAAVCRLP
jgi:membrane protease YdiL (CAAX protease family)